MDQVERTVGVARHEPRVDLLAGHKRADDRRVVRVRRERLRPELADLRAQAVHDVGPVAREDDAVAVTVWFTTDWFTRTVAVPAPEMTV